MVVACMGQCSVYRRIVRDGGYMHSSVFSVQEGCEGWWLHAWLSVQCTGGL